MSVAQILFSLKRGENDHAYGHVKSVRVHRDFRGMGLGPLLFKEVFGAWPRDELMDKRILTPHLLKNSLDGPPFFLLEKKLQPSDPDRPKLLLRILYYHTVFSVFSLVYLVQVFPIQYLLLVER